MVGFILGWFLYIMIASDLLPVSPATVEQQQKLALRQPQVLPFRRDVAVAAELLERKGRLRTAER